MDVGVEGITTCRCVCNVEENRCKIAAAYESFIRLVNEVSIQCIAVTENSRPQQHNVETSFNVVNGIGAASYQFRVTLNGV
jgi:hypothetical protein